MRFKDGQFPNAFYKDGACGLSAYAQAIHGWICFFRNSESGESFPSIATLAERTGLNRKTVMRGVRELIEAGWIEKRKRWRNQNSYLLRSPSGGTVTTRTEQDEFELDAIEQQPDFALPADQTFG